MLLETAFSKDPTTGEWLKKVDEFDAYRGTREFEAIRPRTPL